MAANKEYYKQNRETILTKQKEYGKLNPEVHLKASRRYVERNREKQNAANKASRLKLRTEVLAAYGNECACCGERIQEFLEAHHKNGGGNKHRKALGGGAKMYGWLKRNNWPSDFGLLCSNCNKAEYNHGICPHKLMKLEGSTAN